MSEITIDSKAFQKIIKKLDFLENTVRSLAFSRVNSRWMSEAEVMNLTGLGKDSLRKKRKACVFNWSTATGRKILYLRKDVEKYIEENSTIIIK